MIYSFPEINIFHCVKHIYLFSGLILLAFLSTSFMLLYSFNTPFTKTRLVYESIRVLEITISMVFNLVFANRTILSCCFSFFFFNYWMIIFTEIFNPTVQLAIPIWISTNEVKAEIETYPLTKNKFEQTLLFLLLIKSLCFICSMKDFMLLLFFSDLKFKLMLTLDIFVFNPSYDRPFWS